MCHLGSILVQHATKEPLDTLLRDKVDVVTLNTVIQLLDEGDVVDRVGPDRSTDPQLAITDLALGWHF